MPSKTCGMCHLVHGAAERAVDEAEAKARAASIAIIETALDELEKLEGAGAETALRVRAELQASNGQPATAESRRQALGILSTPASFYSEGCGQTQAEQMEKLLKLVGEPGQCRGCDRPIYWVRHANGNRAPYTPAGLNHFIDCPRAAAFARRTKEPVL